MFFKVDNMTRRTVELLSDSLREMTYTDTGATHHIF